MGRVDYQLRPAIPGDDDLLLRVYRSTREEELRQVPWTEAEKAGFCLMQHRAQDAHYRQHYPGAEFLVIECGGQPAGRLYVDRWERETRIMDLALLPEYRNQGIGTDILTGLIAGEAAAGRLLSIHVERHNPALRLYERLGFEPAGEAGLHLLLHRRP